MKQLKQRGHSIVEVLTVIAAMVVLGGIGAVAVHHASVGARERSLQRDVAALNRAVGVYLLSGGAFADPDGNDTSRRYERGGGHHREIEIRGVVAGAREINGLRGSMADPRLRPVMYQGGGASEDPLVVWNHAHKKFEIVTGADHGIENISYDDALAAAAPASETRAPNMALAKDDTWIWDYDPTSVAGGGPQGNVNPGGSYGGPGGFIPGSPSQLQLQAPGFSEEGGLFPLLSFDRTLTLNNPNPPGTSQIVYSVNGGPWIKIPVTEGEITLPLEESTVQAYVATIDPDHWIDSTVAGDTWTGQPVNLLLAVTSLQDSYSYAQVGGVMLPSAVVPLPAAPDPVEIRVTNFDQYPAWLFDGGAVNVDYSYSGGDPGAGGGLRGVLSPESPAYDVDISLDKWGAGNGIDLHSLARTNGSPYVLESSLSSKTLGIAKTDLPGPISSLGSGVYTTNQSIRFKRDAESGDVPEGARIFVTSDGSDPLGADGGPAEGAVEITDGITADGASGDGFGGGIEAFDADGNPRVLRARVAGPEGFEQWFTPGPAVDLAFEPYELEPWNGYIVGKFGTSENKNYRNIKRQMIEGVLDETFDPGSGFNAPVKDVKVLSDGRLIVVGHFTTYRGETCNRIVCLLPDGEIDHSLDFGDGFDGDVECVAIHPAGDWIIAGGDFLFYRATSCGRVACINMNDGSLEPGFQPGSGADNDVYSISIYPDGQSMILGGNFTSYNQQPVQHIVKINANGNSIDSFGTGTNGVIFDTAIQSDGKVVLVGDFSNYRGANRIRVARINADGSLDTGFTVGYGANKEVYTVSIYPQTGKIFIGGRFSSYDRKIRKGVARLNTDGSRDEAFDIGNGLGVPSWRLYDSGITKNGKVIVGGRLTAYNPNSRSAFKRLNDDGTVDPDYHPEDLPQGSIIYAVAIREDTQRAVVAGDFDYGHLVYGQRNIGKLDVGTGARDAAFDVGSGAGNSSVVDAVAVLGGGQVLVGGDFTSINGYDAFALARMNADGSLDRTFAPVVSKGEYGFDLLNFEDNPNYTHGTIIDDQYLDPYLIGVTAQSNGLVDPSLAALFDTNTLNTLDPDLESPWSGGNISQLPQGLDTDFGFSLIIADNGDADGDGVVDTVSDEELGGSITFDLGGRTDIIGFQATFLDFEYTNGYDIILTEEELAAGAVQTSDATVSFSHFVDPNSLWYDPYITLGDNYVNMLPTIWTDDIGLDHYSDITFNFAQGGAIDELYFITDSRFDPGDISPARVMAITVTDDNKIMIGGKFGVVNGYDRYNIARLNDDGSVDTGFDPGRGFDGAVRAIAVDGDGMILVGGGFSSYNEQPAPGLVRLFADGTLDTGFARYAGTTVSDIEVLPDGSIAYCGDFTAPSSGVAVVDSSGVPIDGFSTGTGAGSVRALELLPSGKLLIAGGFENYNGVAARKVARLLPNGSLDTGFIPGAGPDGDVRDIHGLPNGDVVIVGDFDSYAGAGHDGAARLLADGSPDANFGDSGLDIEFVSGTR